ncbi:unnamed protein product [Pseudo-nitzschia multistriata]|uniref:VASt domain-containing protein n=1 Tax=Pseudo-nitzschia multistriata TaxID=183589 RepID=A0A448ZFL2_9STRA|nr:unnamed protein product [Pseudo-nitzschia multistriata]
MTAGTEGIALASAGSNDATNKDTMALSKTSKTSVLVIETNDENIGLNSPSTDTTLSLRSMRIEEQSKETEVLLVGLDVYSDIAKDDDCESVSSSTTSSSFMSIYFERTDFLPWENLYAKAEYAPHVGFAIAAGGFACMHPFMFFAGAVTAMGALRAAGAAYDYATCSLQSVSTEDADGQATTSCDWFPAAFSLSYTDDNINDEAKRQFSPVRGNMGDVESVPLLAKTSSSCSTSASTTVESVENEIKLGKKENASKPVVNDPSMPCLIQSPPKIYHQGTLETLGPVQWVKDTFPSLPTIALDNAEFRGLYAQEFFDVFFADDAPFGFPAFHKLRRDKEVKYGLWRNGISSEIFESDGSGIELPPTLTTKERDVEYHAKTNSFLGPAYAPTKKTQRAYFVSKKMLVVDIKMTLHDIPFSKQFYLIERWIIDGTHSNAKNQPKDLHSRKKNKNSNSSKPSSSHCVYVTVSSKVCFTQECAFESTIAKESAKQVCEISKCWNIMAQDGLKRTEEARMKRLRQKQLIEEQRARREQQQGVMSSPLLAQSSGIAKQFENDESIEIEHLDIVLPDHKNESRRNGRNRSCNGSRRNSFPLRQKNDGTQTNRRSLSRKFSKILSRSGHPNGIDVRTGNEVLSSPPKVRISSAPCL